MEEHEAEGIDEAQEPAATEATEATTEGPEERTDKPDTEVETPPPTEAAEAATEGPEERADRPDTEAETPPPTEAEKEPSPPSRFRETLVAATTWLRGNWIYLVIAALVAAALVLPPISLPQRLGLGYEHLTADHPTATLPEGGLSVSLPPDSPDKLCVKLASVPAEDIAIGTAGADLQAAAAALPQVLQPQGPYYTIHTCSRTRGPALIEVAIPQGAEALHTLDLYGWTGETWEWIGGGADPDRGVVVAQVAELPQAVALVQTMPVVPAIETVISHQDPPTLPEGLTQAAVPGLYLGTDGLVLGDILPFEAEGVEALPLLRNWKEGEPLNTALLSDLLGDPAIQQTHIQEILTRLAGNQGVILDYQGVSPEQRETFSTFVADLAQALHEEGLRLEVVVPAPTPDGDEWDSGGYDWAALGQAADALIFPLPDDPAAYAEGGEVESLLRWATGQVNRYKLRPQVSALSADSDGTIVQHVSLEEALAPFGEIQAPQQTLEPGEKVVFSLTGRIRSIVTDEDAGTYAITYEADDGTDHTVWLGTPSFLARKLDWALRYHLGGVMIPDLLDEGNMPGIVDAVEAYRVAAGLPAPTELEVTWTVEGPGASTSEEVVALEQPDFEWTAPEEGGTYTISAAIADVSHGSVQVAVATPTPTPTPTPEPLTAAEAACLSAAFVTDVTVPDGTQFDNGEVFTKTWRLRNNGTCDWPDSTVLVFVSGSQMSGPGSVEVGAVEAGETVDISVRLTAPQESGRYTGLWALQAGDTRIPGGEVTVVIQAGEVAAAPPPPAPAPVVGGSFELGGHIHDLSFPYASLMHYAGMTWAKTQVHYPNDASGIIQAAHANGFKIQLSALGKPEMVTQPGFEQDFANWVASLAAAGADAIEVWNEPNIDREWQSGYIDPAAYTRLLCTAYQAIKAANPNTLVISAAPAPTGYFGGCSPAGCDDQPWMEGMFNAGAANCMDYIGAHHNSGATSPSARTGHPADHGDHHHSWYFLPQTELYYNIFRGTRQLFYTEMGYASQEGVPPFSDQFAWARGNDNSEQAAWLAEAVRLSIQTGMVRCIIVWNIDFPRFGYDPQDGYAIVRPDGSCPACDALHAVLGTR
ncbi:MAG TPA: hypothetical protein ENK08_02385 [Chloroflexi bacterium]|nr:hypothetical protein [Chloroflexota bacterium]